MKLYRVTIGARVVTFGEGTPVAAMKDPAREGEIGAPGIVVIGGAAIRGGGSLEEIERALLSAEVLGEVGAGGEVAS